MKFNILNRQGEQTIEPEWAACDRSNARTADWACPRALAGRRNAIKSRD
jgi:hypothetical protein